MNKRRLIRGEDAYHTYSRDVLKHPPIQVGIYAVEGDVGKAFEKMIIRTNIFMQEKMWLPSEVHRRVRVIQSLTEYDTITQTCAISVYCHHESNTIYVFFNHEVVGGGDFLQWGAFVLGGDRSTTPSLIPVQGYLTNTWSIMKSIAFNPIYHRPEIPRGSVDVHHPHIYERVLDLSSVAQTDRRLYVVQTILQFIFDGGGDSFSSELFGWLPVAFEKPASSRCNNVGIMPFVVTKNKNNIHAIRRSVSDNAHMALSSSIVQNWISPTYSIRTSEHVKKRSHVVITMGHIRVCDGDSTGVKLSGLSSGFLHATPDSRWQPYPFYALVAMFNERVYITLTVYDIGFRARSAEWCKKEVYMLTSLL